MFYKTHKLITFEDYFYLLKNSNIKKFELHFILNNELVMQIIDNIIYAEDIGIKPNDEQITVIFNIFKDSHKERLESCSFKNKLHTVSKSGFKNQRFLNTENNYDQLEVVLKEAISNVYDVSLRDHYFINFLVLNPNNGNYEQITSMKVPFWKNISK